ncbi:hypothetical protein N8Z75_02180 [Crocinitomicaceae bacterium]|nr:hypothetical protein [Crocinitomicaceae bacterium]
MEEFNNEVEAEEYIKSQTFQCAKLQTLDIVPLDIRKEIKRHEHHEYYCQSENKSLWISLYLYTDDTAGVYIVEKYQAVLVVFAELNWLDKFAVEYPSVSKIETKALAFNRAIYSESVDILNYFYADKLLLDKLPLHRTPQIASTIGDKLKSFIVIFEYDHRQCDSGLLGQVFLNNSIKILMYLHVEYPAVKTLIHNDGYADFFLRNPDRENETIKYWNENLLE